MISPKQTELARVLLGFSQQRVAEDLGTSNATISKTENGKVDPSASFLNELETYYESHGVEFLDGDGVRFKPKGSVEIYRGKNGFRKFMIDVYVTVKGSENKQVFVNNVNEEQYTYWQGGYHETHLGRMVEAGASYRIIVEEADQYHAASKYAEYRGVPKTLFSTISYYIYGNKAAIVDFKKDNVVVYVIDSASVTEFFKEEFDRIWDKL